MLEAILFDLDGTLVDFVDTDVRSLQWLHSHLGLSISFESFLDTAIEKIMEFHELVDANKVDPLLLHKFRLQNTFARYGIGWNDRFIGLYRKKLIELCVPFTGIENILTGIRKKVKTGVISNAYDSADQRERIRNARIEDLFDIIVIAGDIGIFKPNPSIFLYALNYLKVSPEKALYVGDSISYDIVGAKSAGMKALFFNKDTQKDCTVADFRAFGVDELQNILNQLIL